MTDEIAFTVLENGLDFVLAAVERLSGDPTARDLKYAVLNLSSGIELLLKARLLKQDWSLIFEDPKKINRKAFDAGNFRSVQWKTTIDRLQSNCGINISENNREAIENLRNRRNRLEHFGAVDSILAIKSSTTKALNFVVDFTGAEFGENHLLDEEAKILTLIRENLSELEHFVINRMATIQNELDKADTPVVECPRCIQKTMFIDDGGRCKFCGYSGSGDTVANEYVRSLFNVGWRYAIDGGEIPIYRCPECWVESLVHVGELPLHSHEEYICFSCANTWDLDEIAFCSMCGNPFQKNDAGLVVCDECFDSRMND